MQGAPFKKFQKSVTSLISTFFLFLPTLWSLLLPNYEYNTTQLDLVEFFSDQTLARFVFGALQLVTSLLNAKRVSAEPIEAYGNGSIGPILLMCGSLLPYSRQFSL